jgi:hypothetical protein
MAVITAKKRRMGIAKIFDALLASIILITIVSVAAIHIARTNHISSDTELELAASSIDQTIQDYERTGLIYYYINDSNIQNFYNLYSILQRNIKDNANSIQLNLTLEKIEDNEATTIASAGQPIKDYVELSYFLSIKSDSSNHYYILKVRVGHAEG